MKMNKKGFTLMEMLIVIAIIAILIAIAIPTFTAALEKSRQKTDLANARALKSLVVAQYMASDEGEGGSPDVRATINGLAGKTGDDAKATFYIAKNGQELAASSGKGVALQVTANWKDHSGWANQPIAAIFDADCKYTGGTPDLMVIS